MATVMRRLLTAHAVQFNLRYKRHGHLFENRDKLFLCEKAPYFLELVRYIHLNPLRISVVKDLKELNKDRYCGSSVIIGKNRSQMAKYR